MGNHVRFISYTGKHPALCKGILTLNIDGHDVLFGDGGNSDRQKMFGPFWITGGWVCQNNRIETGEWEIILNYIPEKYRQYAMEIRDVFCRNVPQGCCGGCLQLHGGKNG